MSIKAFIGLLAVVTMTVGLASGAQAARLTRVGCGQTITVDTRLANDLTNCAGSGIVIGADGISVDLNGHTVDGDGVGIDPGIDDHMGHDRVTITNGTVQGFGEGIVLIGASDSRLGGLVVSHQTGHGISVQDAADVDVAGNTVAANLAGIVVVESSSVRVEHNTVSGNDRVGIGLFGSHWVRVAGNVVSDSHDDAGVAMYDDSDNNLVERNVLTDNVEGINIALGSDHEVVRNNVASGGFDGVLLSGTDHNRVTANVLRANTITGIGAFSSDDNVFDHNSVSANGDGSEAGIHVLADPETPDDPSDRNVIADNTALANVGDGILIDANQSENTVARNVADANTDDGIEIDSVGTVLTHNLAERNHDLGIEAVVGVTDAGANLARANGNPLQCTNVRCRPGPAFR